MRLSMKQLMINTLRSSSNVIPGMDGGSYACLQNYSPPPWASKLRNTPTHRAVLANLNTPIHKWNLPGVPEGFEIFIKRDDMTGSTLSGSKVRRLEFLFPDAIKKGCTHIVTFGNLQSNRCRATAIAARQLGMECHVVLKSDVKNPEEIEHSGNFYLNKLVGADLYLAPHDATYENDLKPRMDAITKNLERSSGQKVYQVTSDAPDPFGVHGYLGLFHELEKQGVLENFDDIVSACSCGGTVEGIAIGNYLTGSKLRVHGIPLIHPKDYIVDNMKKTLHAIGLGTVSPEDIIKYIEGYNGDQIPTDDISDTVKKVSKYTGIILDPVYTGKAACALVKELNSRPEQFKGKRILFLHTGGIFGMFSSGLNSDINDDKASNIFMWPKLEEFPGNIHQTSKL